jgi:hypothetical protein
VVVLIGGPAQVFPPIFFFVAGDLQFRSGQNPQKNRQTPNKVRLFFDTMRIPPPHRRDFTIDLQQRWSINCKICDCHATYYLIVCGVTVAILLLFFVVAALGRNNRLIVAYFSQNPPLTCQCQSESFTDAEWHGKGGRMFRIVRPNMRLHQGVCHRCCEPRRFFAKHLKIN